ncbi:hypothetical protein B0T25DRAFT_548770 [Lasiosphaeria hispida]|uniref:Putative gamma-glutamylcyclotransferase n=1 Tax=Lasiosphaeria hispida TaxID=260671 RepID=A0AAJ0HF81_9PEZI|nr:hypothetical protein B0T25DRAFT_548770 [Lasiosphaeria hispida]
MSPEPRPFFIYGTLCALPLLAWAMIGEATKTNQLRPLLRRAVVHGYKRYSLHGLDYPAAIQHTGLSVDGYFLAPQTTSQRCKLDGLEGESYKITPAMVTILGDDGQATGDIIKADLYVWVKT